jgi:TonB family protein
MKLLFYRLGLLGSLCTAYPATAQNDPARIVCLVEPGLELRRGGGSQGIVAAIQQRLVYPPQAVRAGAEGRVFVSFVVTPAGHVRHVVVVRTFRQDCARAAVAAVCQLPLFKPRRQAWGATSFTVPITFRLAPGLPARHSHSPASHKLPRHRNPNP